MDLDARRKKTTRNPMRCQLATNPLMRNMIKWTRKIEEDCKNYLASVQSQLNVVFEGMRASMMLNCRREPCWCARKECFLLNNHMGRALTSLSTSLPIQENRKMGL